MVDQGIPEWGKAELKLPTISQCRSFVQKLSNQVTSSQGKDVSTHSALKQ